MVVDAPIEQNILFVCDFPFAGAGGVGRVTEVLTSEFLQNGCNVTYLALCSGQECISNSVTQYFLPNPGQINSEENFQFVIDLMDELHIDIILNQAGAKAKVINFFAKIKIGRPFFSIHHNCVQCLQDNYQHILTQNFKTKKFFKLLNHPLGWFFLKAYHKTKQGRLFKNTIRVSDKLVLLSDIFVPEMKSYVPNFSNEKVISIPNPAPFAVNKRVESKKENRLIFVGRVSYQQKRVDLLLALWRQIYHDFPYWHFDIVGDGDARQELEKRAKSEKMKRIHFHGFQDPRPYLEKAKFFCMTSAFEGFPMVLVEAQAYGVVPFTFDCFSALPDIIQSGENGFVFQKFNLTSYADTLKQLMNDDRLRKRLAKNGQASLLKYDPKQICGKWLSVFQEVSRAQREKSSNEN